MNNSPYLASPASLLFCLSFITTGWPMDNLCWDLTDIWWCLSLFMPLKLYFLLYPLSVPQGFMDTNQSDNLGTSWLDSYLALHYVSSWSALRLTYALFSPWSQGAPSPSILPGHSPMVPVAQRSYHQLRLWTVTERTNDMWTLAANSMVPVCEKTCLYHKEMATPDKHNSIDILSKWILLNQVHHYKI